VSLVQKLHLNIKNPSDSNISQQIFSNDSSKNMISPKNDTQNQRISRLVGTYSKKEKPTGREKIKSTKEFSVDDDNIYQLAPSATGNTFPKKLTDLVILFKFN
jgi:hypothetical protein